MLMYSCALKKKTRSKISNHTVGPDDGNSESVTFNEIKRGKESKNRGLNLSSLSISIQGSKTKCPFCIIVIIIIIKISDLLSDKTCWGKKSN